MRWCVCFVIGLALAVPARKYAQKMRTWIEEIEAKKSPALADPATGETSDEGH